MTTYLVVTSLLTLLVLARTYYLNKRLSLVENLLQPRLIVLPYRLWLMFFRR